jgi:hypothetical protein
MSALFRSFWMAGFESACQVTTGGCRLDMIDATQHDRHLDEDYFALRGVGIATVREALRWHRIEERPGVYDFSTVEPFVDAARTHGIQIIWSLFHYGWPDDVDIFTPAFVDRFARFAHGAARFLEQCLPAPRWYTPINEISFMAWAGGEHGFFNPFTRGRGTELKRQLVRAELAAIDAVRAADPGARFMHTDPVVNVVPPGDQRTGTAAAERETEAQHEARDAILGRRERGLGGGPDYLDVIGVNFYPPNQWEHGGAPLRWRAPDTDPRWEPLHRLLARVYERYGRPMAIAETSALGDERAPWLLAVAHEVRLARDQGIPVEGICLYPAVSRPDWNDASHWHDSGLWDIRAHSDGRLHRELCEPYAAALAEAQELLGEGRESRRPAAAGGPRRS